MGDITQLPEELIDNVCLYLEKDDIHNFRLTCRDIKDKSHHRFAVVHFGISQFMITQESLQTLVDIAKDQRYGPRIKELQLCLVHFPRGLKSYINGEPFTQEEHGEKTTFLWKELMELGQTITQTEPEQWDEAYHKMKAKFPDALVPQVKLRKRQRRRNYGRHQTALFTIRKQGIDVKLLTEALRNLPGLESISLVDQLDEQQPPWGARQLRSELGQWPFDIGSRFYVDEDEEEVGCPVDMELCSHALALTLGAIVRSGIKLKRSLRVTGVLNRFDLPKTQLSRRIRPSSTPAKTFSEDQIAKLQPAFADLKELSLSRFKHNTPENTKESFTWMSKYTPLWPAIEKFSYHGEIPRGDEVNIGKVLSSGRFTRLRHLNLNDMICVDISDLVQCIQNNFNTLESLCTADVHTCLSKTGARFNKILEALLGSPAMVSLELANEKGPYFPLRTRHGPQLLEGVGLTRFIIRRKTPAEFQSVLESALTALQYGDRVDIARIVDMSVSHCYSD